MKGAFRVAGIDSTSSQFDCSGSRQVVGTVPAGPCLTCPSFLRSDGMAPAGMGGLR